MHITFRECRSHWLHNTGTMHPIHIHVQGSDRNHHLADFGQSDSHPTRFVPLFWLARFAFDQITDAPLLAFLQLRSLPVDFVGMSDS